MTNVHVFGFYTYMVVCESVVSTTCAGFQFINSSTYSSECGSVQYTHNVGQDAVCEWSSYGCEVARALPSLPGLRGVYISFDMNVYVCLIKSTNHK